MRYFVTVNFEIHENDNEMAIAHAKQYCEMQRNTHDNHCQLVYVVRSGFGTLESEEIYNFKNPE